MNLDPFVSPLASAADVLWNSGKWLWTNGQEFISAVAGSGFGAWMAFRFAERHRQAELREREKAKTNEDKEKAAEVLALEYQKVASVFFILVSRISALENYARKYLAPDRKTMGGNNLLVTYQICPEERISLRDLSSLTIAKEFMFMSDILVCEVKYLEWVDCLKERNHEVKAMLEILQSKGVRLGQPIGEELAQMPQMDMVETHNDMILRHTTSALEATQRSATELSMIIKRMFPGLPSLKYDMPSEEHWKNAS